MQLHKNYQINGIRKICLFVLVLFFVTFALSKLSEIPGQVKMSNDAAVSEQTSTGSSICHAASAKTTHTLLSRNTASGGNISKTATAKTKDSGSFAQENSQSSTIAQQLATTIEAENIVDNGFGIAAGGELIYWQQEDLNKFFQELNNLGVTWVRWDVDWQAIQPDNSQKYNWEETDRVATTAKKYGVKSLGIVTYAPKWASRESCPDDKLCPPESVDAFADFAGTAAQRYKGLVDDWEIWNEPNEQTYWYPLPDAADYTQLLKASYAKIKEANPDAVVVSAGLTDMGDEAGVSISPLNFVNTMYENGAKDYFDIMALHPYTYPGHDYGWPQIIAIWKAMDQNGDGEKKIWLTEYGAPTGGPGKAFEIGEDGFSYGEDFMSEEAQSQMAESVFAFKSANPERVGNVFWYSLCDSSADKSTSENFFGILRYDGTKKPVYQTLKELFAR